CQVTIRWLSSLLGIGIADIKWGPLYKKRGEPEQQELFLQSIRELKQEYAIKRGLFLRIWPQAMGGQKESVAHILKTEGFKRNDTSEAYRTLRLDLSPSLEDLRKNLLQKWRNCLNRAEKNGLRLVEGTN